MAKTFWDYLSDKNKERYKYLLKDEKRFTDFDIALRSFVLTLGNTCFLKGCDSYEDAEKYNTIEEISKIVNENIYPDIPSREVIESMPDLSAEEIELLG